MTGDLYVWVWNTPDFPDGTGFYAAYVSQPVPDNAGNGVTRVRVITSNLPGFKIGSVISVATKRIHFDAEFMLDEDGDVTWLCADDHGPGG